MWTSTAAAETSLDAADANTCPLWRHREANVQAELPADSHCYRVDNKFKEGDTWMSKCVHVCGLLLSFKVSTSPAAITIKHVCRSSANKEL